MTCEHSEHLLDLVYGELDDAEATALRREVEACEACREELAELEATKRLADQLPLEPMPSAARSAILAAARDQAAANAGDERAGGSAEIDAGKSEEKTTTCEEGAAKNVEVDEEVRKFEEDESAGGLGDEHKSKVRVRDCAFSRKVT